MSTSWSPRWEGSRSSAGAPTSFCGRSPESTVRLVEAESAARTKAEEAPRGAPAGLVRRALPSSPASCVLRRHRCPPGKPGGRWRMPVTYPGPPTTMGTPSPRRVSQAGSGSFSGLELLAVPPKHAGVDVDDEPPARRVARVAADRPWVGRAGAGREPVVGLARDGAHRARSGAVVGEERWFMRMADESERAQRAVGQDSGGRRLGEEPEQGVARRAVPAVDAVTAGLRAARQPVHVASAGDDPVRSERPGVVISGDQ